MATIFKSWGLGLLFLSTISPLALLLPLFRFTTLGPLWSFTSIVVGFLFFVAPLAVIPYVRRKQAITQLELDATKHVTPDLTAWLFTYLVPLFGLIEGSWPALAGVALLLLLASIVYVRSGLIYLQPVYFLFGWHVFECTQPNGATCWVLSQKRLLPGTHNVHRLGGGRYLQPEREP